MNKVFRDSQIREAEHNSVTSEPWGFPDTLPWPPRRMSLAGLDGEHEANADRRWLEPVPTREPHRMDEGEWEPCPECERVLWIVVGFVLGVPLLVWAWRTWL